MPVESEKEEKVMNKAMALQVTARGEREIVMTRTFNAPRHLVFEAFTRPDLIKRWLIGPDGWSMPVCEVDLKVGGRYRYVWRYDKDGKEMGMGGAFNEITPPERIVVTERFDDAWYDGEAIITMLFIEQGSSTQFTQTMLYQSRAARDGVLKSPMEKGVAQSYTRLDQMLASIAR